MLPWHAHFMIHAVVGVNLNEDCDSLLHSARTSNLINFSNVHLAISPTTAVKDLETQTLSLSSLWHLAINGVICCN